MHYVQNLGVLSLNVFLDDGAHFAKKKRGKEKASKHFHASNFKPKIKSFKVVNNAFGRNSGKIRIKNGNFSFRF